jgi:hypothetical protein
VVHASILDVGVLDRVHVDRTAVGVLDQLPEPVARRQLNTEVLSASIERKSLPVHVSIGTIRRIGKRLA